MEEEELTPFDVLFVQIAEILKYIEEKKDLPLKDSQIPADIQKKLGKMEKKIKAFDRLTSEIIEMSGVSQEEIMKRLQGVSTEIPIAGQQLLERGRRLQRTAENLKMKLSVPEDISSSAPTSLPPSGPSKSDFEKTKEAKNDKKLISKRKRKFRQIEGGPGDFRL